MAVATNFNAGKTICEVSNLDADWSYLTDYPTYANGLRTLSIQVIPSAKTDVFVLKDGSATGPDVCYCSSLNNFETTYYEGVRLKPYFDQSDRNSFGTPADAKFIFVFGGE